MSANHLELVKQVAQDLETIIVKIDSLDFFPITWEDSYSLLRELEATDAKIDELRGQLESIFDESFCDDVQNKAFVENIDKTYGYFDSFSMHFSRIYSVLEEEGPKEWYDKDYEYLSAQLKKAKQHLDQILM